MRVSDAPMRSVPRLLGLIGAPGSVRIAAACKRESAALLCGERSRGLHCVATRLQNTMMLCCDVGLYCAVMGCSLQAPGAGTRACFVRSH